MNWFKFYGQDWLTDLKIMRIIPEDRLCYITLLCLASSSDEQGIVRKCDEEAILQLTHLYNNPYETENEYTRAKGCLQRFKDLGMITVGDNGDVEIVNFEKRQGQSLTGYERVKRFRENHPEKVDKENMLKRKARLIPDGDNVGDNVEITSDKIREDKSRVDNIVEEKTPTPKEITINFFKMVEENGKSYDDFMELCASQTGISIDTIKKEVKKFVDYWTEPNSTGKKQRWEQQQTFEVKRRLTTWFSNSGKWSDKKFTNKNTPNFII
jgi:hypothetical protein